MNQQQSYGFTLIELVLTIILLGILSVSAVSMFSGRSEYNEYVVRDNLVTAAQIAQQRAMYDHDTGSCYRLTINLNQLTVQRYNTSTSDYDNIGPTEQWRTGIALEGVSVANQVIYFDGLGSPLDNTANCAGTVAQADILINSAPGVRIYETGYIQAQF